MRYYYSTPIFVIWVVKEHGEDSILKRTRWVLKKECVEMSSILKELLQRTLLRLRPDKLIENISFAGLRKSEMLIALWNQACLDDLPEFEWQWHCHLNAHFQGWYHSYKGSDNTCCTHLFVLHLTLERPSSHENIPRTFPPTSINSIARLLLWAYEVLQNRQVFPLHIVYAIHRTNLDCHLGFHHSNSEIILDSKDWDCLCTNP